MPVLRSARALAEAPITIVKKNPIDAKVKSLQDQLAAAHAQNERDGNEMKSLRAEVAKLTAEKDAAVADQVASTEAACAERDARIAQLEAELATVIEKSTTAQQDAEAARALPYQSCTCHALGAATCHTKLAHNFIPLASISA